MKVAILISGEFRFCQDFDKQIENYQGFDKIDWFVSAWDRRRSDDRRIPPSWTAQTAKEAKQYLEQRLLGVCDNRHSIADCSIIDAAEVPPMPRDYPPFYIVTSLGCWQQFQSLKMCNQLRVNREAVEGKYDLVIRSRPDLSLNHVLNLKMISQSLAAHPNAILIPKNERRANHPQFSDVYAIGTSDTITTYCNAVDDFDWAFQTGTPWNPEWLMQRVLMHRGLVWPMTDFEVVMRQHGKWIPNNKGYEDWYPEFGRWA